MRLTDHQSALVSYKSYFQPEYFDKIVQVDAVLCYVKYLKDETLIVFPGTRNPTDVIRDIASIAQVNHPILGPIAFGFSIGIDDILEAIWPLLRPGYIRLIGHSLGGARAFYIAALLYKKGIPSEDMEIIALEPPRPGGQQLVDILKPFIMRAYINGDDIVPHEPSNGLHPSPLIQIMSQAPFDLPGKFHHIQSVITSLSLREFDA